MDILLARAADPGARVPGWADLIENLKVFPHGGLPSTVSERLAQWPTELAFLARLRHGDETFQVKLHENLQPRVYAVHPSAGGGVAQLVALARSARILVTLNYTKHLADTLTAAQCTVRQYDRPQLGQVQSLLRAPDKPGEVRLVYLHGRFGQGVPVLDAWGYSVLNNEDPHYTEFLRALFTSYDVVTLGVSWADIPLREAASYVCRTQPYARRTHVALMFHGSPASSAEARSAVSIERTCANAMSAVFGVTAIPVDPYTQPAVLGALNTPLALPKAPAEAVDQLPELANFLDACGDYECIEQHRWLMLRGQDAVESQLQQLVALLIEELRNASDLRTWATVARIERHVRHHLYIYLPKPTALRASLWAEVATTLLKLVQKGERWDTLPPRLRFDFLTGIDECDAKHAESRVLRLFRLDDAILERRIAEVCPFVWLRGASQPHLLEAALDTGWESMAPKVLLDQLTDDIKKADPAKAPWTMLMREADRAAHLARSAGCFRRLVKADLFAAFWDHDPERAAERLRARIDSIPVDEPERLERPLWRALAVGRILCTIRRHLRNENVPTDSSISAAWDASQPAELAAEARTSLIELDDHADRSLKYWAEHSPFKNVVDALKTKLKTDAATLRKSP